MNKTLITLEGGDDDTEYKILDEELASEVAKRGWARVDTYDGQLY